ncbi:hypothetical protein MSG28_011033 [Choristoneura fumiferana]|uniref:Uncharacterized protein n=1 Tax=Choristoneura fumiferana TaxID=7141 RepID=A0ACC0KQI0_CHOFU|nr:hypothetical protein MSG28_011033 [Choristoneura fumiferana]
MNLGLQGRAAADCDACEDRRRSLAERRADRMPIWKKENGGRNMVSIVLWTSLMCLRAMEASERRPAARFVHGILIDMRLRQPFCRKDNRNRAIVSTRMHSGIEDGVRREDKIVC